jgi:hypothetical protein
MDFGIAVVSARDRQQLSSGRRCLLATVTLSSISDISGNNQRFLWLYAGGSVILQCRPTIKRMAVSAAGVRWVHSKKAINQEESNNEE